MARKIVITSGKGGVGKTTVAVNLAVQLSKRGERVVLCDADFGLNGIDLATGLEGSVVYDMLDVVEGRCRAKQALVRHPDYGNLYILSSARVQPERYVSPQSMKLVLDNLSPQYDYILIDSPAGVDEGFHRAVAVADEAIVVATPSLSSVRDADKVITLLKSYRLEGVELVVNRARGDLSARGKLLSPQEISALLKVPLLGVLPDDDGICLGELGDETHAFKLLAVNLLTGRRKLYDAERKYVGLFGELKRFFGGGA